MNPFTFTPGWSYLLTLTNGTWMLYTHTNDNFSVVGSKEIGIILLRSYEVKVMNIVAMAKTDKREMERRTVQMLGNEIYVNMSYVVTIDAKIELDLGYEFDGRKVNG